MHDVAVYGRTERRYLVVLPRIPGRDAYALCADFDGMPQRYRDPIETILRSGEPDRRPMAEVLARHYLPGSQRNLISALHYDNLLVPLPIEELFVVVERNGAVNRISYREVLDEVLVPTGRGFEKTDETVPTEEAAVVGEEIATAQPNGDATAQPVEDARALLERARMLEAAAAECRMRAYALEPTLFPAYTPGDPSVTGDAAPSPNTE